MLKKNFKHKYLGNRKSFLSKINAETYVWVSAQSQGHAINNDQMPALRTCEDDNDSAWHILVSY